MVLLLHWSLLNYAAVVKILKKHGEPHPLLPALASDILVVAHQRFGNSASQGVGTATLLLVKAVWHCRRMHTLLLSVTDMFMGLVCY